MLTRLIGGHAADVAVCSVWPAEMMMMAAHNKEGTQPVESKVDPFGHHADKLLISCDTCLTFLSRRPTFRANQPT